MIFLLKRKTHLPPLEFIGSSHTGFTPVLKIKNSVPIFNVYVFLIDEKLLHNCSKEAI